MRTWGGAGVSVLVCTRGAGFEVDWWKFGGVSVDTTILHTFLYAPACTACADMVYSKELVVTLQLPRWQKRYCA